MTPDIQHAKFIEQLGDANEKRMATVLQTLESRIAAIVASAPTKAGKLFDLEWAIAARQDILIQIRTLFLAESTAVVNDYSKASESLRLMLGEYGDFVGVSEDVVRALKRQSFQGFEAIASRFLNEIADEVYQNTLTGRTAADSITALRQKINGVFAASDKVEVARLVDIANAGGKASEDAIKSLHSIFAADKLGNNMRRYSTQIVHDSLMQFDASIAIQLGKESGADAYKYYGSTITDTREFCRRHAGKTYTEEEIREIWQGDWAGKAPGDPFIVRGGYGCRHHFRPVFQEEIDEPIVETQGKPQYLLSQKLQSLPRINEFSQEMNKLSGKQISIVNKLPPIENFAVEGKKGYYRGLSRKLVADPKFDGGSVVRHEYGHHVDFELGRVVGNSGFSGVSATDSVFLSAFDEDRKGLGLHRSATFDDAVKGVQKEIYNIEDVVKPSGRTWAKKVLKDPELGNFSDIVDALSYGKMQKTYGGHGHGVTYFKRKEARPQEAFANLFALRNTKHWSLVQEKMPSMAKRFDEIIEEGLK